jgi:hypothetical protein
LQAPALFRGLYSLSDKVFELRHQSPPFNNVLFLRLTQGSSFLTKPIDKIEVRIDMTKRRKNLRPKKPHPDQDHFLMRIKKNERLYKFYYFRPVAGRHYHFEYRILSKEKINGMLEMVSYNFKIENGVPQKSSITRVPEISEEQLDQIVQNVFRKTNTDSDEFEEVDLSEFSSIDEQIEYLKSRDRVDTMYIT